MWRVPIIFVSLLLTKQPYNISLKESAFSRFNVVGSNHNLLSFHVKCPLLTKFVVALDRFFMNVSNIKFYENPFGESSIDTLRQKDVPLCAFS
jgi:hypothetical protein